MFSANFPWLYGITDTALMPGDLLEQKVEAALAAGLSLLQYRDKSADNARREREASALQALCRKYSAVFIVNDDVELARIVDADGVHLGREDESIAKARAALGAHAIIGATCHNQLELAQQALARGANYLAFGRFFSSQTKANAVPADLQVLAAAKRQFEVPIVGIGGVNTTNVKQLWQAGADCAAVCHALFAGDKPADVFNNFSRIYQQFRTESEVKHD